MGTLRQVRSGLITLVALVLALAVTSTPASRPPAPSRPPRRKGWAPFSSMQMV